MFSTSRPIVKSGANERHWRRKWEIGVKGFYGLPNGDMDILAIVFLDLQARREQSVMVGYMDNLMVVSPANHLTADTLPHPHDSFALSESSTYPFPTTRSDLHPNCNHTWYLDSYRTLFSNDKLLIVVNELSLKKNWCDLNKLILWTLKDMNGLLLASDHVRASPTKFIQPKTIFHLA